MRPSGLQSGQLSEGDERQEVDQNAIDQMNRDVYGAVTDDVVSTKIVILGFPFTVFVSNKNGLAIAISNNAKIIDLIIKKINLCFSFSLS